jgi:hypothetical protein
MDSDLCLHHLDLSQTLLDLGKASRSTFARGCTIQQRLEHSKLLVSGLLYRHDGAVVRDQQMLMSPRLVAGREYLEEPGRRMHY